MAGLLTKSSCLAVALGVTKFETVTNEFGHTVVLITTWMFNKPDPLTFINYSLKKMFNIGHNGFYNYMPNLKAIN